MIVTNVSAAVAKNGWCQPSAYSHHLGGWLTVELTPCRSLSVGWKRRIRSFLKRKKSLDLIFLEDFVKCQHL